MCGLQHLYVSKGWAQNVCCVWVTNMLLWPGPSLAWFCFARDARVHFFCPLAWRLSTSWNAQSKDGQRLCFTGNGGVSRPLPGISLLHRQPSSLHETFWHVCPGGSSFDWSHPLTRPSNTRPCLPRPVKPIRRPLCPSTWVTSPVSCRQLLGTLAMQESCYLLRSLHLAGSAEASLAPGRLLPSPL